MSNDDETLLVMRLGLSEASAGIDAELSLRIAKESARQALLERASTLKQLDTRMLANCFKQESNELRATTLLLLVQTDAGALSKPDWIECLEKFLSAIA